MRCKNKRNKKKNNKNVDEALLVQTVKKEAASPAHLQDNNRKSM